MDREKLAEMAKHLIDSGECSCYGEVALKLAAEIEQVAKEIGQSAAYVMACTIDDVECLYDDESTLFGLT